MRRAYCCCCYYRGHCVFFFFLVSFGRGFDALPNGCLQVSALMLVFSLSSDDAFQKKVADVTAARYLFV